MLFVWTLQQRQWRGTQKSRAPVSQKAASLLTFHMSHKWQTGLSRMHINVFSNLQQGTQRSWTGVSKKIWWQLLIKQFYFNFELCYSTKSTNHSHEDSEKNSLPKIQNKASHKSLHEWKEEENQALFYFLFLGLWEKWDGDTAVGDVSGWSVFRHWHKLGALSTPLLQNRPQMHESQPCCTSLSRTCTGLISEKRHIDPLERWVCYCLRHFNVPKGLLHINNQITM